MLNWYRRCGGRSGSTFGAFARPNIQTILHILSQGGVSSLETRVHLPTDRHNRPQPTAGKQILHFLPVLLLHLRPAMQHNTCVQAVLFLKIGLVAPGAMSLRLISSSVPCSKGNDPCALQSDEERLDLRRNERGRRAGELFVELLGGDVGKEVGEGGSRFGSCD